MKVLLTGASGFIGGYVLAELLKHDVDVVTIGRMQPTESTQHIELDLAQCSEFCQIMRRVSPTHLIHLAWYAEHGKYWSSSMNIRWVDITNRLVLSFCENGGKHAIIAGTCAEYDWGFGYCREYETPVRPATLYGIAKDATRRLTESICKQNEVSHSWMRVFQTFGIGEYGERLIPSLINVFNGKRRAFGVNGCSFRDYLHVSDVAKAFANVAIARKNGIFNVSSGRPIEISELVKILASLQHRDPNPVLDLRTERPNEPRLLVGDNVRLLDSGWKPTVSIEYGLEQMVRAV